MAKPPFGKGAASARVKSKSLELRATRDLARLCAEKGRSIKPATFLAPIYGWFTEGFDTVDLKEAKALLDELREPRVSMADAR
jgi:predicted ATPase